MCIYDNTVQQEHVASIIRVIDGDGIFLWKLGNYQPNNLVSLHNRIQPKSSPWRAKITRAEHSPFTFPHYYLKYKFMKCKKCQGTDRQ